MTKRIFLLLMAIALAFASLLTMVHGLGHTASAMPDDSGSERSVTAVTGKFVPIGASYQDETLTLFAQQALAQDSDGVVKIRVLPITFASDPYSITQQERTANYTLAMTRAMQIQDDCAALVVTPTTCDTTVIDMQVRSDAQNLTMTAELTTSVDGVYILGGDQVTAMMVIANTPAEMALEALHLNGTAVGGNSAGAAVQSRYMIAGYTGNNGSWNGLQRGSVDLWYGPTESITRGLRFGLSTAVVEQHILERGRIARLLQAAEQMPTQNVALGVDWGTGIVVSGNIASHVAGYYDAIVLDEETYGAADTAAYVGLSQTLSIHNVALHVLASGDDGYDLDSLLPMSGITPTAAPTITGRNFDSLTSHAGTLYVGGDLLSSPDNPAVVEFAHLALTPTAVLTRPLLIVAAGYLTPSDALSDANAWVDTFTALGVTNIETVTIMTTTNWISLATKLNTAGAVFMTGYDQALFAHMVPAMKTNGIDMLLHDLWHGEGVPLFFDAAAAAALGHKMSAMSPLTDVEVEASDSFIAGHVVISDGLDLLSQAVIEPRVLYDYLYGRLVSHALTNPDWVVYGLERGTAVKISETTTVMGDPGAVMVVDGRYLTHNGVGSNGAYSAHWLLLDTFASGETIATRPEGTEHFLYLPIITQP